MPTRHEFGGLWTQAKLDRVAAYLPFFTQEMRGDHRTVYFDAFAGTGTVDRGKPKKAGLSGFLLFPDPAPIDGSAKRALQTAPPFDRYIFVEQKESHCSELRRLRASFPELADRVKVRKGDANEHVASFCNATDWSVWRAVFLLDPYGLAVNWDTIETIAKTEAADVWYLFPISATLRMLQRREKPSRSRKRVLDRLFGERGWYQKFYHSWERGGLISAPQLVTTRHADEKVVIKYFVKRLRSVFEWVSQKPLRLFSTNGPPLFHLYFMSSIPGKRRNHDIVQDILRICSGARDFRARFEKLWDDKRKRMR